MTKDNEDADELGEWVYDGKLIVPSATTEMGPANKVVISEISRPIEVETENSFEENRYKFEARGEEYIPLPDDGTYYSIDEGETKELDHEMVVKPQMDVFESLEMLLEYPFLLVDHLWNTRYSVIDAEKKSIEALSNQEPEEEFTPSELRENYPEAADDLLLEGPDRYEIFTVGEVNRRRTRDALFPLITQVEQKLALLIEEEYPNSEKLADAVGEHTKGVWEKNRGTESEVHIAEFMSLADMRDLIGDSETLARKCGFETAENAKTSLHDVKELRNKVMHANRSLIDGRKDLHTLTERLDLIDGLIQFFGPKEESQEDEFRMEIHHSNAMLMYQDQVLK